MRKKKQHKQSRLTLLVTLIAICMLVLSACSGGKGSTTDKGTTGDGNGNSEGAVQTGNVKPVDDGKKWVIKFDPQGHLPRKPDAQNPAEKKALDELNKEYEALHPNVKIELVKVPNTQDRNAWLQARMMAKDAPDIFWLNFESTWDHYQKGWFYPVDEWMKDPTPYNDNKVWGDTFVAGILDSVRAPNGKLYDIPADGVGVAIFYNKKIFQDLNLEVPKTWKEFMDVQAKIKASGVTPFAFNMVNKGCCDASWSEALLHNQFLIGQIDQLDENKNNRVDPIEIAHATKSGLLPNNEILKQEVAMIKEWMQYWPKGYASKYDQTEMFTSGKAAMVYGSSGTFSAYRAMNLPFEWGAFNFPVVTKESAPLSTEKGAKILGPWGPGQWIIPGYLEKEDPDKLQIIKDYLMFLSKPESISKLAKEAQTEPNIIGATAPEGHEVFQEDLPIIVIQAYDVYMGRSFSDKFENALMLYLNDSISMDEYLKQIKQAYDVGADETIAAQEEQAK
ncbi:ABC transporter substrate-binding protein [Paenibacillus eucommiae]|uniref:ABC-type glycerol-3-phosphate transport system substrate-binding protein n=1 Tax=Paenibacillus eucommiae TaxID=1355755 RepID=A0ABS4J6S1_9BACL|nr:extracellular solute-binding protein [Paenibacillus eucommiae]MBP1994484.1 ABC-type glycerol-3-phosphate transport system substrate-binding protein [Paenibacillus eucommiae]